MFNLEEALSRWRDGLNNADALSPLDVTELEAHLREEAARVEALGLTAEEALKGFTVNSARALGLADKAGRIAVGRAADLAVWDTDDPRGIAYPIGGAPCLAVVKDGVVVHEAAVPEFRRS